MRSTTRIILAGSIVLVFGALTSALENSADPFPGTTTTRVVGAILLGLGASLLASGVAARLISNQVVGLDIAEAIEALRGTSPLVRSNQTIEITLRAKDSTISAKAEHRFEVLSSFNRRRSITLRLYTDVARWGSDGGFSCVVEPDGTALRDEDLGHFVREVSGRPQFEKTYNFRPGVPEGLVVETFAAFRLRDRLIWTIEQISRDLRVRVNDYTGLEGQVDVKINHHRSREISEGIRRRTSRDGQVSEFAFIGAVLPYQGFELQWEYRIPATKSEPPGHRELGPLPLGSPKSPPEVES